MLTRILFLSLIVVIPFTSNSQDETGFRRQSFPGKWSVSYKRQNSLSIDGKPLISAIQLPGWRSKI